MKTINSKKEFGKIISRILLIAVVISSFTMPGFAVPIQAESTICGLTYSGSNEEKQDYKRWSSPISSYLHDCGDGTLLRVQKLPDKPQIVVEYYDREYNLLRFQSVNMDLKIFGGFYALGDFYYILSGQANPNESDEVEVYRITKYDKSWNKIGSCGLKGANTTIPFDAGSARMTSVGDYLLIRTCHEMYAAQDGKCHQTNETIEVDTNSMEITSSSYPIAWNVGYVSHSFNQFIQVEDNKVVAVDHGDAFPIRGIILTKYQKDCSDGIFFDTTFDDLKNNRTTDLLSFPGEEGDNETGASIGGFEISDSAYLVAGNYVIDSGYADRNIFIAKQDKATGNVSVNYITDYNKAEKGLASTPQFVSLGNNRFLLLWSLDYKVYYTEIDGDGNRVGDIYHIDGALSDCVPILLGNKLVWYVWDNEEITFYEINTQNLSETDIKTKKPHDYVLISEVSDGRATFKCKRCGDQKQGIVPTWFDTSFWKNGTRLSDYSLIHKVGDKLLCYVDSGGGQFGEMELISSDTSVITVEQRKGKSVFFELNVEGAGITEITVRPKYNPGIAKTYLLRVGEAGSVDLSETDITFDSEENIYTGEEIKPSLSVRYKGIKLSPGEDYTVSYEDNINTGTASVSISGKGFFAGTKTLNFTIQPIPLSGCSITAKKTSYVYSGSAHTPDIIVKSGTDIVDPKEYTITYRNNVEVGTASAIVEGKGNYNGTAVLEYRIEPLDLSKRCSFSQEYIAAKYTGKEITPYFTVKYGDTIIQDENYTVSYSDNIDVGIAKVTITGNKNCIGTVEKPYGFRIEPIDLKDCSVTVGTSFYEYSGSAHTPDIVVKSGTAIADPKEYRITYKNNVEVGTASAIVTASGNYVGTMSAEYTIGALDLSKCSISLEYDTAKYTGRKLTPHVTVQKGDTIIQEENYTVDYKNNVQAGTANVIITGRKNCTGIVEKSFKIDKDAVSATPAPTATPKPAVTAKPSAKGTVFTVSKQKYKVTSSLTENPTVICQSTTNTKTTSITIPATVKVNGIIYKVTAIANGAFKGNKKLTKVTIGKNITTLGKSAFQNCTTLKNIVVKTSSLKTVGKNALKGTRKKLVIKVPGKKLSAYKKLFKGKGNTKIIVKKA